MATISIERPLEIESVVDNLFQYLELKDIIKQRSVSKIWHRIGTKHLVNRIDDVRVKFGSNFSLDKPNPRKTVENFLQMQANCSFKFTNIATYYFDGDLGDDLSSKIPTAEQTARLFDQYGIHMKKVKLDWSGKNWWKFIADVLLNKAPNLEELHLDGFVDILFSRRSDEILFPEKKPQLKLKSIVLHSEDEFEDPTFSRDLLTDLFQCSANLESLHVALDTDQAGCERVSHHELLILETLADKGNLSNLKVLTLDESIEDIFAILAVSFKRAPLEVFDVSLTQIDSMETLENVETFLKDHKDTWKQLHLSFPCVEEWMDKMNFMKMINLTHLSISERFMDETELDELIDPFGIADLGQLFPNLKTLSLHENPKTEGRTFFDLDEWFPEAATPVLSLTNLTLPPQFHAHILRRIGRIFPNVTKLDLTVQTADVLKELWITWPKLQMLDIRIIAATSFGPNSLDSIFTGIPDESMKISLNDRKNPIAVKCFPFIGQLKRLTHLKVFGPSHCSSYKINQSFNARLKVTDATVRLALATLTELVFLRITGNRHEISPSCVQDLCTRLGLHKQDDGSALRLVKYEWQKNIRVYDW